MLFLVGLLSKADVETGRSVHQIQAWAAMNSVAWNPKRLLLAYASDDDNKHSSPGKGQWKSWRVLCAGLSGAYLLGPWSGLLLLDERV